MRHNPRWLAEELEEHDPDAGFARAPECFPLEMPWFAQSPRPFNTSLADQLKQIFQGMFG